MNWPLAVYLNIIIVFPRILFLTSLLASWQPLSFIFLDQVMKFANDDVHEEINPVIWWIYEQRLFNIICDLPVFENFRIWKQFTLWKSIIRSTKTAGSA